MTDIDTLETRILRDKLAKLESLHSSYNYLSISIASSNQMKKWSQRKVDNGISIGEVLSADTVNYRTGRPVPYGLFCEQIFGPVKNYTCRCGRYSGIFRLKVCENCQVELIDSRVRRYRMGHTELITPIAHLWYCGERSNYLQFLINDPFKKKITTKTLKKLIYYKTLGEQEENELERYLDESASKKLIKKRKTLADLYEGLRGLSREEKSIKKKILKKKFYEERVDDTIIYRLRKSSKEKDFIKFFFKKRSYLPIKSIELENSLTKPWYKQKTGSEFLKSILDEINLQEEVNFIRKTILFAFKRGLDQNHLVQFDQKLKFFLQKLRILESFLMTKTSPGNLVLTTLPILPPALRPFFQAETGTLISSDINSAYRLIITKNNNLATQLFGIGFLSFLTTELKRQLQEAVDNLIESSHQKTRSSGFSDQKPTKGLLEILEGKYGHFRHYLLGKRVDYSGRSVIVSAPGLRFNQCGLPYEILLKLFQPQILKKLTSLGNFAEFEFVDLQLCLLAIAIRKPFVFTILKKVISNQKILLNRAPTLHKYGIQSFEVLIVLNKSIHLHPVVCSGFNADFDGDQMGIHVPLFETTQMEASQLMKSSRNFFSLANSESIMKPTQDMVMGCYYLTYQNSKQNTNFFKWYLNYEEAVQDFLQKKISLHNPILVRKDKSSFNFFVNNNTLFFSNPFIGTKKKIEIFKISKSKTVIKKLYFFTNIGIIICSYDQDNLYKIIDFFAQTTVGRILFDKNFEKVLLQFNY